MDATAARKDAEDICRACPAYVADEEPNRRCEYWYMRDENRPICARHIHPHDPKFAVHYQTKDSVWHLAIVEAVGKDAAEDLLLKSLPNRHQVQRIWSEDDDGRYTDRTGYTVAPEDAASICRSRCPHYDETGCVPQICAGSRFEDGAWTCARTEQIDPFTTVSNAEAGWIHADDMEVAR
jgi:hypothetical protein